MSTSIEERIERQLDRLEDSTLSEEDIELIQKKIEVLRNTVE